MDRCTGSVATQKHLLSDELPLGLTAFDSGVFTMAVPKIPQAKKLALLFMGHADISKYCTGPKNIRL